jgi:hypothetical protein
LKSTAPLEANAMANYLLLLYFTLKNSFRNGSKRDCNGPLQNNNRRCNGESTAPLEAIATVKQWLFTFSWLYFTLKNRFRNSCNGTIGSPCNG